MGPYQYKTVYLSIGTFGSPEKAALKLQDKIDEFIVKGWELFEYHPIQTMFVWKWNIIIFRKPTEQA